MNNQQIQFRKLEEDLYRLEEILKKAGSKIPLFSKIETAILSASQLLEKYEGHVKSDENIDIRPIYRNLFGFHDLTDKLLKLNLHPAFNKLLPHIRLLTEGVAPQNIKAPFNDDAANKLFELYIATASMRISEFVSIDEPVNSKGKGDNPDVIFNFKDTQIGIACKALQTQQELTLITNLEKAIDQIEKSPAKLGLVFVALKNVIDHDSFGLLTNLTLHRVKYPIFLLFQHLKLLKSN